MSEETITSTARSSSMNIMVLLAALIPVAFIFGFWASGAIEPAVVLDEGEIEETIMVSMILDYGDGTNIMVENISVENMTVYELLVLCSNSTIGNYTYASTYWPSFDSLLVDSIEGYANGDDGKWWEYTIDGEYPMVGADKYLLEDGDIVEWVFKVPVWI